MLQPLSFSDYYNYTVYACNQIGCSGPSNVLQLRAGTVPSEPRNIENWISDDQETFNIYWDEAIYPNGWKITGYQLFMLDSNYPPQSINMIYWCEQKEVPYNYMRAVPPQYPEYAGFPELFFDRYDYPVRYNCSIPIGHIKSQLGLSEGDKIDA